MLMRPKASYDVVQGPGDKASERQAHAIERALKAKAIRISDLSYASRFIAKDSADAGWYCLAIRGGRERSVFNALEDEKILALMPMRKGKEVYRRGRIIEAPMLPVMIGYLLVRVVPKIEAFRGLRHMDDVTDIVGGMMKPFRVPDKEVLNFKKKAEDGHYDYRKVIVHYDIGELVRVTDGPFAGFLGRVIGVDNLKCGQIDIEVSMFGRLTRVHMVVAQIEKV